LIEYIGEDSAINVKTEDPEFSEWKWIEKEDIVNEIVSFKRELYENIISEFLDLLK
jgi:putative (di)nucleoside polyphosphate hydrolase